MDLYLYNLEQLWADRNELEETFFAIESLLKDKPSYVDFFVQKWHNVDFEERCSLYLVIISVVPIKDCLDFGMRYDDCMGDQLMRDFEFWWLKEDGSYSPMSWEEYEQWLEKQKKLDGRV